MGAAVLKRWTFRTFWSKIITLAPVAQLDRVSDSDSEGHRFDSCRVYHTPAVFTAGAFFPSAGVLPDADAACRPAGLRLRKRCRHFAVLSPFGLLTPPAGCTKPLRRFSPQGFLFSEQESYPTLTLRAVPQDSACGRDAGTSLFCRLLGLLTPPAGCTTLPPFLRRELSFPRQESYLCQSGITRTSL